VARLSRQRLGSQELSKTPARVRRAFCHCVLAKADNRAVRASDQNVGTGSGAGRAARVAPARVLADAAQRSVVAAKTAQTGWPRTCTDVASTGRSQPREDEASFFSSVCWRTCERPGLHAARANRAVASAAGQKAAAAGGAPRGTLFIDASTIFRTCDNELLFADYVKPNEKGQALVGGIVARTVAAPRSKG